MRRRAALAVTLALLRAGGGARAQPPGSGLNYTFTLQNGAGNTVTNRDFPGRYLLVFFGYTNCPDVCPVTLEKIARALPLLGARAQLLQPIFITLDPTRDTPAITARYAALFSPAILGLSGSPQAIAQAIAAFHVYASPPDPRTGAVSHGTLLYLTAPNGPLIAALPGTLTPPALAAALMAQMRQ
jgi:protein SCO1/2